MIRKFSHSQEGSRDSRLSHNGRLSIFQRIARLGPDFILACVQRSKEQGRFEFRNSDRGLRNRRAEGRKQKAVGSSPREITNQLSHGVKQEADGRRQSLEGSRQES